MNKITEKSFKSHKSSDTLFILGSGWSVNGVDEEEWDTVRKHDSIGFNWFCRHEFEPTYYLIREQANLPSRRKGGDSLKRFIRLINRHRNMYCCIADVRHHTPKAHNFAADDRIEHKCWVVNDNNSKKHRRKLLEYMDESPSKTGLLHGNCTLFNVMHLAKFLGYKKILFIGIDLNNSRYFWLKKNQSRYTLDAKGKTHASIHPVASEVMYLVKKFKKFDIEMYTTNKRSLLTRHIPYKSIRHFERGR